MKTIKHILTILFILFYLFSFSQHEFVVEINKISGSYIETGPGIAGITYIYPDDRAFDESTGTFIFQNADSIHRLFSINVSNDSIINNPIINNFQTFQFDNTTHILYGLEQDNANNVKNFISINPVTGTYTKIGNSLSNSSMYGGGYSTFNKINHTYIFLDSSPYTLCSVNTSNGSVISNPNLSLATGEYLINFSFDNSTGILYGLLQDTNVGKYFLVTINPTTGANTRIGLGTTFGGGASSTIDEANQQYSYLYNDSIGYVITTLDMKTGNVVYNALIEHFNNNDNFYSLKYDNTLGKLYALHWGTNTPTNIAKNKEETDLKIYPNPTSGIFNLQINKIENIQIQIYDVYSKCIYQNKITSSNFQIDLGYQSSGVYFVQLITEQGITNKKLIIQK